MEMNRKISQSAEQYNEQHILNEVNQKLRKAWKY